MYQIQATCVCCHNCAMECPMGAIGYVSHEGKHQYQIDPDKCVECGLCAKLCHTCSIVDDAEPEPSGLYGDVVRDCDIVVCGGGTGLIAAVHAAQKGKRVILLEKSDKLGGNTDYAHMFFPVFTNWHEHEGLADVREEAVEEYWKRSGGRLDKGVVRSAVYGCGEFFDWLCTFPGTEDAFEIKPMGSVLAVGPIYSSGIINFPKRMYDNLLCRDQAIGPGWGGTFMKYEMLRAIRDQKLWVEILTGHTASQLLTDENGAVTGVLAKTTGGNVQVNAKAVILATGGLGRSDEKMQKYFNFFDCETPIHRFSVPGDTGDAIDLLQGLGVEPPEERINASIFGPAHHPYSYCLYRVMEHPSCLLVNLNGKRWHNEENGLMGGRFHIAEQPKEISWGIFDQAGIDEVIKGYRSDPAMSDESWIYERYQTDLAEESALPHAPVRRAETLAKLAEQIEVPVDIFVDTIRIYNAYCANGEDADFGKASGNLRSIGMEGPYYAIYGQRFSEGAFGGIRVNAECEVTREDGMPIPGLYGVGDATSAMQIKGELAVISELTWATASAYLSGQNAAGYIDRKEGKADA